ncbi:MAG TPA: lytic transglycosylase domain-containing protein [Acidimicrobiales bacterium]
MSCRSAQLLAALVAAVAALGAVAPAHAQVTEPTVSPDISPALDDIEVDSVEYSLVAADYELVKAARLRAAARLAALAVEERDLAAGEARAGADARLARTQAERWRRRVGNLAVQAYIGAGGDDAAVLGGLDPGYTLPERRALLVTEVDRDWRANLTARQSELAAARVRRNRLERRHQEVVADQTRTEAARAEALGEERRLRPAVQAARATAVVVGSDLTLVALDAYLRASLEVNDQMPGCRLPWWLLAGIGRVESGHGTFATSELDAGGTARPSIIGIALDGGNSTAVITDSDGGVLDGDLRSDRAVGPMQFIPSTWARYAADGNGDGVADPQNLYDAAHAAGQYLCTAAGDLGTDAGVHRGIFAYNHSEAYVNKVLSFAHEYVNLLT